MVFNYDVGVVSEKEDVLIENQIEEMKKRDKEGHKGLKENKNMLL